MGCKTHVNVIQDKIKHFVNVVKPAQSVLVQLELVETAPVRVGPVWFLRFVEPSPVLHKPQPDWSKGKPTFLLTMSVFVCV